MSADPADQAFQLALRLLSRRDHFVQELGTKLRDRGCDDSAITVALGRCKELGYLDDERLAARFVELRAVDRGWGTRRLAAELERRGVSPETAEQAIRTHAALMPEALQQALQRAERSLPDRWWTLHAQRARMLRLLVNRGFAADEAYQAVSELAAARETEHDAYDDQPGDQNEFP